MDRARPLPGRWLAQHSLLVGILALAASVIAVAPFRSQQLAAEPSFVPAMLALLAGFDLLSTLVLVGQFRESGEAATIGLASAYLFALGMLVGFGASFPGVLASHRPLDSLPSTSAWLWITWHAGFSVVVGIALGILPRLRPSPVVERRRASVAAAVLAGALALAGVSVLALWNLTRHLPVIIHGRYFGAGISIVGPYLLTVVVAGTLLAVFGASRCKGPERWAALAASSCCGEVVLTLRSGFRYSVGWYAGRTLSVVASAAVLVAFIGAFTRVQRRLTVEGHRLRTQLARTDELEQLQRTLLENMAGGVVMESMHGEVVAFNAAARELLGHDPDVEAACLNSWSWPGTSRRAVAPDGTGWTRERNPASTTRRTGEPCRDGIVGIVEDDVEPRWLAVSTDVARDKRGRAAYVITSLSDATAHERAAQAVAERRRTTHAAVEQLIASDGGIRMIYQPIVELQTGLVVGAEALARFATVPERAPDVWFAEAAEVGLGPELELEAIRLALGELHRLPEGAYLSINASPATLLGRVGELLGLLDATFACRLVLELTEHESIEDYGAHERALEQLRSRGVRLAVDDAGSGFSSLLHILNLHPDVIKLDIGLIRGIEHDRARRALTSALLSFEQEIGAVIVAEGIETPSELGVLCDLGVRFGQGYYLGRPGPLPLSVPGAVRAAPVRRSATGRGTAPVRVGCRGAGGRGW